MSKYWEDRFTQLEDARHAESLKKLSGIQRDIDKAQRTIEGKINAWYQRIANNNQVSMSDAKKLLTDNELKEFKWDLQEYIKYGEENALNQKWMKELENASAKYHISRLEQLKIEVQQQAEVLYGNQLDDIDKLLRDTYTDGYYHTCYEVQKGFGVGYAIASIDKDKLTSIINKPWSADGRNFSDRIWSSKTQLIDTLHKNLTQMCILGEAPDKTIKAISKAMNVSKYQAGRLVMTESAYFGTLSQQKAFQELDVEEYEIVATLDGNTSEICQTMDGQHFPMNEMEIGVTAPPFHPNCRTCTCPWFDDDFAVGERAARDEDGETYYIPANTTYEQWKSGDIPKSTLTPNETSNILKVTAATQKMIDALDKRNVTYNEVSKHSVPMSEDEIINTLAGGDRTSGSCASVGLSYVGQKNGLDVLDFRGGESQKFFSYSFNLRQVAELPNVTKISEIARSSVTSGKRLLALVEEGNEYYFVSGRHAAIVRKNEGILQYLELQSESRKGWTNFNSNVRYTLANRFGENKGYDCESYMFNVKDAEDSFDLQKLLGYINTSVDEQKKGVGGDVK